MSRRLPSLSLIKHNLGKRYLRHVEVFNLAVCVLTAGYLPKGITDMNFYQRSAVIPFFQAVLHVDKHNVQPTELFLSFRNMAEDIGSHSVEK